MTGTANGKTAADTEIAATVREVRAAVRQARSMGRTIGFVPTMGALHAGHLSLVDAARKAGDYIVVSIYINPTQFGPGEDLDSYPHTMDADREACQKAGVSLIFAPSTSQIYPPADQTRVRVGPLADTMCGDYRPGHFEGVCTVVTKLFNIIQPDVAYFGQKDAQQAVIVRRIVRDLHMPVRIEVCPIVRESDGLALSSRNVHLGPVERERATCLYKALCSGRDALIQGERSIGRTIAAMRDRVTEGGSDAAIEYFSIVNPETLLPVDVPKGTVLIAAAVRIGETRLIDNLLVDLNADAE